MKAVLQLLTGADVKLAKELSEKMEIEVVDLTRKDVDYRDVLEKIFAADSIQVW
jgi:hypothetical protein